MREFLKKWIKYFFFAGFFSLFINLLNLTFPIYMLAIYDRVLSSYSMPTLMTLSIGAVMALIVLGLLNFFRSRLLVQAGVDKNPEIDELELYCSSVDKAKKEEGIKNRFQQRFEADLLKARNALDLKNGMKRYEKVVERIGRLKEKYKLVSHRYQVKIEKDSETDRAKNITWKLTKVEKTSGIYCLRTNQKELTEQQIWDIYTMLTDVEDAFRCMKSHLGLRPNYHQKEARCDAHIFITVIAYHLLHTIRYKLRQKGVRYNWATLRKQLSTQVRITTTMKRKDNKVVYIRRSTKAELPHQVIYDALDLPYQPGRPVKTVL